jgi:hypothetical protein
VLSTIIGNFLSFLTFGCSHPFVKRNDLKDFLSTAIKIFCGVKSDRLNDGFFGVDPGTRDRLLSGTGFDLINASMNFNNAGEVLVNGLRQAYYDDFLGNSCISTMRDGRLNISGRTEKELYIAFQGCDFPGYGRARTFVKNTRMSLITSLKLIQAGYYEKRNYHK